MFAMRGDGTPSCRAFRPGWASSPPGSRSYSVPPRRWEPPSTRESPPQHVSRRTAVWASAPLGLSATQDGTTIAPAAFTVAARPAPSVALPRAGRRRERVRGGFEVEAQRRLHLIVVRRDLTGYQHLHPAMAADGTWSVPLEVRAAGAYRVFADFQRDWREARARPPTCSCRAIPPARRCPRRRDREHGRLRVRLSARRCTRGRGAPRSASPSAATDGPSRHPSRTRRARPPRGAARGRPRVSCTSTPRRTRTPPARSVRGRLPLAPAPTACSCSSRSTASSTPRPSRRGGAVNAPPHRPAARAADRGHDVRLVRDPHRAQAQQARRRRGHGQLRDRAGERRASTPSASTPGELVDAVEAAGYAAHAARRRRRRARLPAGSDARAAPPPDRLAPSSRCPCWRWR